MQVVICAIAKNEHLYINEFVKHYKKLGFSKLYLFDNDDLDSKYIGECIDNDLRDFVEIIDRRGIKEKDFQTKCYQFFYDNYQFEWCLFCDIDEYLVGIDNIQDFLNQKRFKFTNQIRIKWKLFGDDDLIERDMNKTMLETFKNEITSSLNRDLVHIGNLESQAKSIVRGGIDNAQASSVHYFTLHNALIPSVLPSGKKCESKVALKENYSQETVYLYHFMTKTLSEFIAQKLNRNDAVFNTELKLDYFWRINKKTEEKIKYLEERGLLWKAKHKIKLTH